MNKDSPVPLKDHKHNFLVEVANAEKQLWALIHSKGLLHSDVQNLYHKVRFSYEKIIFTDHEQSELQDAEYSLWKLHYKHIDEFRKTIKKSSGSAESTNVQCSNDNHIEGFKLFVAEAIEFYQNLILDVRKYYGLPEDSLFHKKGVTCTLAEPKKMHKCQFLCHRFFVCLGDLARYRELYENPNVQNHNWSVAATYYLESTLICPDSGNPQNQLAVLATYVGDEFLALYHCIRSLAVKEPFPDAWDNLILLFERNRSSHLHLLSKDSHFDFLKPFERSSARTKSQPSSDSSLETNLWSLLIGMMGFFFIKSSLEDFPCAFASAMTELEALMALDEKMLEAALESYQLLNSSRTGPFRPLQVVSVFIFIIPNLMKNLERKESNLDIQLLMLTQLALTATFIFMGRITDRCLEASPQDACPLLPAVLVFVEWLVNMLDEAENYGDDEKSNRAMFYFFGAFIELLNRLMINAGEVEYPNCIALWEDFELRGFAPVARAHKPLDFSAPSGQLNSYKSRNESRTQRILTAAMKIARKSNNTRKWIFYDKVRRKFYAFKSNEFSDRRESETEESSKSDLLLKKIHQHVCEVTENSKKKVAAEVHGKSVSVEEEEVILFKPLTRYNSAPVHHSTIKQDYTFPKGIRDQSGPSDECLHRATSLLIAQNQTQSSSLVFHPENSNFKGNKELTHQFPDTPITAGPPSLSAWVLNQGSLSIDRGMATTDSSKQGCNTVEEEIVYESLTRLSMNETEIFDSNTPYSAPTPSAPLLPDDAIWYTGLQSSSSDYTTLQAGSYFQPVSGIPCLMDEYPPPPPPPSRALTSSEWLSKYREKHNLPHFDLCGIHLASNPMIYVGKPPTHPGFPCVFHNGDEHRREKLIHGYQKPIPYGCGNVTDKRYEQQPLVQYLKEKEWLYQQDPSYMGN